MVVQGESGLGKSALLANWLLDYSGKHPDDLALIHFIGSASDNADATRLMQRIMMALKRRFDRTDAIPVFPNKIREESPNVTLFNILVSSADLTTSRKRPACMIPSEVLAP